MNTRLEQFLAAENITQSQFADTLGVASSSISHLLGGRNKPSYDFIESLARCYPELNLEWLITGNGTMYKKGKMTSNSSDGTLFGPEIEPQIKAFTSNKKAQSPKGQRSISKIMVFYDDGTFEELSREG
ncbi:MAG: helix-turn-helix domain-containing protein [Candidatus Cryptobacteroides sp.]